MADGVWNNFQLAPQQTATASIQVSFTPSSSQAGSQVPLSDGISADATDTVTGQTYSASFASLSTPARVQGASSGARTGAAGHGGGAATTTRSGATSGTARQPGLGNLPTTGGGAFTQRIAVFGLQFFG